MNDLALGAEPVIAETATGTTTGAAALVDALIA